MLTDEQIIGSVTWSIALSNNESDDDLREGESSKVTNFYVPPMLDMAKK